jgi:hypothetical protein
MPATDRQTVTVAQKNCSIAVVDFFADPRTSNERTTQAWVPCQPHLHPARNRDHRRRAFANTATIALTAEASTGPMAISDAII